MRGVRAIPTSLWLKAGAALVGAGAVVWFVPRIAEGGSTPPVGVLLATGLLVSAVTTALLWIGLRLDLKLPTSAILYAVVYNVLIVVVKFVLGPAALYEVNRERPFETFWPIDEVAGSTLTAAFVLVLYAIGLRLAYVVARRRLQGAPHRLDPARKLTLGLVFGVGIAWLLLGGPLLIAADAGVRYLSFVFSSASAILIGITLAAAAALASQAFHRAEDRRAVVAAAATTASLFWVGLTFLALYHVLWVVYLLVLTSIWPLRMVVPK